MPRSASTPPFRKGLSLGWKLTLASTLVVTSVMAFVMVFQWREQSSWESAVAEQALLESLRPLAARLGQARSLEEINRELTLFHQAYTKHAGSSHFVALSDAKGGHLYGFPPEPTVKRDAALVMASLQVDSAYAPAQNGTLFVWDSGDQFNSALIRQRRLWWWHFAATLVALVLSLHATIYFLLTRPLAQLLDGVKLMQMGYLGTMAPSKGAWEIRWLAWRFQRVAEQLVTNAKHLVEAERRAAQLVMEHGARPALLPLETIPLSARAPARDFLSAKTLARLADQCSMLGSMSPNDRTARDLAMRTWETDAREAERLGNYPLRCELEDASLRILESQDYLAFKRDLIAKAELIRPLMDGRRTEIADLLKKKGIPFYAVDFRTKHPASAWRKKTSLGIPMEELHDLYGFRVIVSTVPDCYWVLGAIHEVFDPLVGKFKDYIAAPKENGYQSLQTSVRGADGLVFEVQIRTVAMHENAERESAAHWIYQQNMPLRSRRGAAWMARFWNERALRLLRQSRGREAPN